MKLWGMCRRGRTQGHNPFLRKLKESVDIALINFLCTSTTKKQFSFLNRKLWGWQEMSNRAITCHQTILTLLPISDIVKFQYQPMLTWNYYIMANLYCTVFTIYNSRKLKNIFFCMTNEILEKFKKSHFYIFLILILIWNVFIGQKYQTSLHHYKGIQ